MAPEPDTAAMSWMARLVSAAGGVVDGQYVLSPGCIVLARTTVAPESAALLSALNIGASSDYAKLAELSSRITYLAFKDAPDAAASDQYLHRMATEAQHLSVFAATHVTFLIAGIAAETSMELCAHREARIARLTTSKTKAMDVPLFRLQGDAAAQATQRAAIEAAVTASRAARGDLERELANMLNPGNKATALTFTMNLKDYHSLFIGRLPEGGNEREVREICGRMCALLHAAYPLVIRAPEAYAGMNNGAKYAAS